VERLAAAPRSVGDRRASSGRCGIPSSRLPDVRGALDGLEARGARPAREPADRFDLLQTLGERIGRALVEASAGQAPEGDAIRTGTIPSSTSSRIARDGRQAVHRGAPDARAGTPVSINSRSGSTSLRLLPRNHEPPPGSCAGHYERARPCPAADGCHAELKGVRAKVLGPRTPSPCREANWWTPCGSAWLSIARVQTTSGVIARLDVWGPSATSPPRGIRGAPHQRRIPSRSRAVAIRWSTHDGARGVHPNDVLLDAAGRGCCSPVEHGG